MTNPIRLAIAATSLLIVGGPESLLAVTNSLTIKEVAGVTTANYPIQIGRPFVAGEIANYPQALINGTPVPTQADVKQRWPDGSVKHAILSYLIPNLSSGSTVTVTFQNQTSGNNTGLSVGQMQGTNFDFNAQMLLSNGSTTVTADARTMLSAGAFTTWTSGGIAQTAIIALHDNTGTCNGHQCSNYDIGFDANKSFRPIFDVTFWPVVNKVRVRFIGEIANSETIQDQTYSLNLKLGNASPASVYTKASFTHSGGTRWTKEFWIGGAPPAIAINHNLSYIRETRFAPYYDTSRNIPSTTISSACNNWTAAAKDIGNAGNWDKNMGDAGSRPDIGLYEDWVVQWLYTGDTCIRDKAFVNADLSASWPVHYREGKAGKILNRGDSGSTGLGKIISISGRPTMCLNPSFFNYNASPADTVGINMGSSTQAVAINTQGWNWDAAHMPEAPILQYVLSGDYWYLEESMFWASLDAASGYQSIYFRGPTGAEGSLMYQQLRAMAWDLRTRSNTAFVIPDGLPEKTYFNTLIADSVALEEGIRNVTTGAYNGTALWTYGRNTMASNDGGGTTFGTNGVVSTLHQYVRGGTAFAQNEYGICSTAGAGTPCNPPTVSEAASLFEMDYMMTALGRCKELGYLCDGLLTWAASLYTGMLTDPGFNPFIIENGRVPTYKVNGTQFATFAELKTGYNAAIQNQSSLATGADPDGYAAYAAAAVSFIAGEPNGQAAWSFMNQNFVLGNAALSSVPKWALLPRASTSPVAQCDINGDGVVNVVDVQLSISGALGQSSCTADLNGDGKCDIVDIQRVINAALGAACRVGP